MKNWKIIVGLVLISFVSAGISVAAYSHFISKNVYLTETAGFHQGGFYPVGNNRVPAENTDFTLAAEQSVNAVVHIKSVAKAVVSQGNRLNQGQDFFDPFEFFFGQPNPQYRQPQMQPQPRVGFGSGVIISTDGYIVTNNHVIDGADEVEVTTNNDETYIAKIVGADEATDIALLKIEGKDFPVIPFGDSDALKVGEWVLAVGNPFNLNSTVTAGIVSAKGRADISPNYGNNRAARQRKIESYIQTDAAVNPGNSGGALVNTRGELVGINTAIYSETGNYVGYSFAVPISIVKKVVADMKEYGKVQRALLGVIIMDVPGIKIEDPNAYNKLKVHEGAYIKDFATGSPALKAGLKEGDVITEVNGNKVKSSADLKAEINRYRPGNKVDIQVQRGDEVKSFQVELKNDQGTTEVVKNKKAADLLGATLKELSDETKSKLGINYGVEVTGLSNGKLKQAGIKTGFIILTANDNRIRTPEDLEKIVELSLTKVADDRVLFIKGIYSDGKITYFALDLND